MEKDIEFEEIMDSLTSTIVSYIKHLFAKAGIDITDDQAKNALSNTGIRLYLKKYKEK